MERRSFLKYMAAVGIASITPGLAYGDTGKVIDSDKRITEKEACLDILNNKSNFNYNEKILTEDWATELKDRGIRHIIKNSKEVLNSKKYKAIVEKKELDITMDNFKKIITINPYFILPITTKILKDYGKTNDEIITAATTKDGDLEKGLWYVDKDNEGKKVTGKVSIPYMDNDNMLIYGDGKKWGVEGKFVSLINYKEVNGKVNLDTCFFVKSHGTGLFSSIVAGFVPWTIAKKVKDNAMALMKNSELLVNVLNNKNNKITEKKYGKKAILHLEDILK